MRTRKGPMKLAQQELMKVVSAILSAYKWKGWTKKQLASRAGISRQILTQMLEGDPRISFYTLAKVCKVLGLSFEIQVKEGNRA